MTNPTAAMLVIGDEILSGRTRDSNMHYLAGELTRIGITLCEVRVVADVQDDIVQVLEHVVDGAGRVFDPARDFARRQARKPVGFDDGLSRIQYEFPQLLRCMRRTSTHSLKPAG